jgi:predicted CoA-binding protein
VKTVAVIGASRDRSKFGNKAVRAFRQADYTVYPVSLLETEIEDLPAYKTILDVPISPDIVSVYVRPSVLQTILPDIAAKGCRELWLNPGTSSEIVLREASRLSLKTVETCSILAIGGDPSTL